MVLCDVKPFQGYHWLENFLADQSKLMTVALHCPGNLYREARSLGVSHCCYNMAEVTEGVKEEESEIEIDPINLEQQVSSIRGRERCLVNPMAWTVRRSDYPTHAPPLHPLPCPCLAQNPSSMHTRSLKVLLPILPQ